MRYFVYLVLACTIRQAAPTAAAPQDVIVLLVDHREPNSVGDTPADIQRWCDTCRAFADRHRDSDGRPRRHSFFYWNYETLRQWTRPDPVTALPVLQLVYDGYGEIDLHVHHNELGTPEANRKHFLDTTSSFMADCRRWSMFTTAEAVPQTRFAFIHGMWALDNSRLLGGPDGHQPQYCGVDTEQSALRELGFRSTTSEGTSTLWGAEAEAFWSHAETRYNDGSRYRLHYMSAREAYNVVRAAQDGRTGNPYDYRDYAVAPYASSMLNAEGNYALESWRFDEVVLRRQMPVDLAAFSLHSGQSTPVVEESPDGVTWSATDGVVTVLGSDLDVVDATPAEYYRIVDLGPSLQSGKPQLPTSDSLEPGAPNPFSQKVSLSYRTAAPTALRIEVFDLRGRLVRTLVREASVLGEGVATWDGRDEGGRPMPDGMYLCRMTTGNAVMRQSVILMQ